MKVLVKMKLKHFTLSVFLFALSACSSASPIPVSPTVDLKAVSIQLSWIHEYSSSAFHAAVREGYFTSHGIDATLVEGGFNDKGYIDPVQAVVDGTVDFGMTSGSTLITAVHNGAPIIGVANLLQRSPLAIMTLDPTIQTPKDFIGRKILVADGGARDALESLLSSQKIALDAVTIVPRTDFGIDPLVNKDVDALVAWRINEGVSLEEQGLNPTFFMFSDYGVENYEFVLFTRQDTVQNKPDIVQGVVESMHWGRDFVIDNPDKAIADTLSYSPLLNRDSQLRRLEASIPLMNVNGNEHVAMDRAIWDFSDQLLVASQKLPADFDVASVYTNQFADASNDLRPIP